MISARPRNITVVVPLNEPSAINAIIPIPISETHERPSPVNATVLIPTFPAIFPATSWSQRAGMAIHARSM